MSELTIGQRWRRMSRVVADVYNTAAEQGLPPAKAVREHFSWTPSIAGKEIMRARELGLIAPTTPGKSGRKLDRCPTCGAMRSRWLHNV